jgi:hypothetical protein
MAYWSYKTLNMPWKKWRQSSNIATFMHNGVASLLSWSETICNPTTNITRIRRTPKNIAFVWWWTPWTCADKSVDTYLPQGWALRFPHGWLKISCSLAPKIECLEGHSSKYYHRGLPVSSLHVPYCNFHMRYKWVMTNVNMTCGKFWEGSNELCRNMEPSIVFRP